MNIKNIIPSDLLKNIPQVLEPEQLRKFVSNVTGDIKERMDRDQELSKRINDAIKKYEES